MSDETHTLEEFFTIYPNALKAYFAGEYWDSSADLDLGYEGQPWPMYYDYERGAETGYWVDKQVEPCYVLTEERRLVCALSFRELDECDVDFAYEVDVTDLTKIPDVWTDSSWSREWQAHQNAALLRYWCFVAKTGSDALDYVYIPQREERTWVVDVTLGTDDSAWVKDWKRLSGAATVFLNLTERGRMAGTRFSDLFNREACPGLLEPAFAVSQDVARVTFTCQDKRSTKDIHAEARRIARNEILSLCGGDKAKARKAVKAGWIE